VDWYRSVNAPIEPTALPSGHSNSQDEGSTLLRYSASMYQSTRRHFFRRQACSSALINASALRKCFKIRCTKIPYFLLIYGSIWFDSRPQYRNCFSSFSECRNTLYRISSTCLSLPFSPVFHIVLWVSITGALWMQAVMIRIGEIGVKAISFKPLFI
jgi:hypothetical protein